MVIGLIAKYVFIYDSETVIPSYNYSYEDSSFDARNRLSFHEDGKNHEKRVDYEHELLDFSADKKDGRSVSDNNNPGKIIEINNASIDDLIKLPGIGVKTARKIIEIRESIGGFERLEDLLAVDGIGEAKFNGIRKFLYIEK